ncbi:LysR family transcriptional regulator [Antarctobacter sp.]|uniref:LysR family transcriptional regulator n=1 Tax=Antarctobacter sp. TaxID=1872577 RepID=UPI002B2690E8|nr:LysR family transcriptional regulator [Antarctobacter sp.]
MQNQIELRHIRYFMVLARELHFGRAADTVGISQAPYSQQIRQLEDRVGTKLFDRTTRRVSLTEGGMKFLEYCETIIDTLDEGVSHARAASSAEGGRLRIGAIRPACVYILPMVLKEFRELYPAVIVDVFGMTTSAQLKALEAADLDIALVRPASIPGSFLAEQVCEEGLCAGVHKDHPLAQRTELTIDDLDQQPIVLFTDKVGTDYSTSLRMAIARHDVSPRIVGVFSDTAGGICLVASGLGIAVLPESSRTSASPDVVFLPISVPDVMARVIMVQPDRKVSRKARDFAAIVRKVTTESPLWKMTPRSPV